MIEQFCAWLVEFVHGFGYAGVFIMTFLESTFVPIPAELTMVPAGYLVSRGQMHFWIVFVVSIGGTLCGSLFNYWIAKHYGRRFLLRYGKYMFFKPEKIEMLDRYFASHGDVSILTGRLIPGLRHFISFPAGLAHMNPRKFCLYTATGGGIWMGSLILIGYIIGDNKALVKRCMPIITYMAMGIVALIVLLYIRNHQKKRSSQGSTNGLA